MQISDLILNVASLFIMMIPGIILKKTNLVNEGFGKGLSNLILYIAQPCLIVYAYLDCTSKLADIWLQVVLTFVLSLIVHVIFALVAIPVFKKAPDSKARMLKFATVFSNAAFMGIPLIIAIMGTEAAIYASVYNISFNLFLWTLGVQFCTRREGEDLDGDGDSDIADALLCAKENIKKENPLLKVLIHPVTLASVIGLLLLSLGVNVALLEENNLGIIADSLAMLKALVAPLSMTVIGLRVAEIDLEGFFGDLYMYVFLFLRHLALPLSVLGIIMLSGALGIVIDKEVAEVTLIMASAPAASSATMFAEKYGCDAKYISRLVVVSTLLSIATMPLILMLYGA